MPQSDAMMHRLLLLLSSVFLISNNACALECQLLSMPNLVFGVYDPLAPRPLESDTYFQIECQAAASGEQALFRINLLGATTSGALRVLQASDAGDQLSFSLYRDARRSIALSEDGWIAINDTVVGSKIFTIPLFAQIFAGQHHAGAGNYTASILLAVEY